MLYVDVKYLNLISHRFEIFKRKNDYLFNVRCPFCGDSKRKLRKMRGYFFRKDNSLLYKCHKCGYSSGFGNVLKQLDPISYKEYCVEKFSDSFRGHTNAPAPDWEPTGSNWTPNGHRLFDKNEQPPEPKVGKLIDNIMDRVDALPYDHEVVKYVEGRGIPKSTWNRLYYIDNIKDIVQLNEKYAASIVTEEPRLAIPFFDRSGRLTAVSLRGMRGETLRYILVKVKEQSPTVFGLEQVVEDNLITVVEGPIDSLFLENCIACSGTSFNKIDELGFDIDNVRIIFDNQPKSREVCKLMSKYVDRNYNVVIWPESVTQKDINDMVREGLDVQDIVNNNTYNGLSAKFKFTKWKKC